MFGLGLSKLDKGLDAFAAKGWKRARRFLSEALTEEETANGAYHLGLLYWRGLGGPRDQTAAAECFRVASEHGHAAAQTAFGVALRSGHGVAQDREKARALFRAAMGAGDVEAMTQLAAMSEPEEARRLYTRAAEQGHVSAMRHLADLIVDRDPIDALAWLYCAVAISADENARKHARVIAKEISASDIEEAQKTGRTYSKAIQHAAKGAR
jgi:TPR repeat protein